MVFTKLKKKVKHKISHIKTKIFPGAIILMYHRIAEVDSDPWSLCVSPQNFAEHLESLQQYGNVLSLQELTQKLRDRKNVNRSIAITFDDGYADNLYNAKPLLEKYNIPATVFITTKGIDSKEEFWWDELDRLLLQSGTLPNALNLEVAGKTYRWELEVAAEYSSTDVKRYRWWRMEQQKDPTPRHSLYRFLYEQLRLLSTSERDRLLTEIRIWANTDSLGRLTHRSLTQEEIILLESGGLIEIGAHTVNHPFLSQIPIASQEFEIQQSKNYLEKILGHSVISFSYPNGSYAPVTTSVVKEAGFDCACCSIANKIRSHTQNFLLPRYVVEDWDGKTFSQWLSKSVTI